MPGLPSTIPQQAYLKAGNAEAGDTFGYAIALDKDVLVIGAYLEDSSQIGTTDTDDGGNDNTAINAGAAYVFRNVGGIWQQEAYLKAADTEPNNYFGSAVAVSGDTIAVGAYREGSTSRIILSGQQGDPDSEANVGAVYIYRFTESTWRQEAYLKASNAQSSDNFGHAVALEGDVLVVGTPLEDSSQKSVSNDGTASFDNLAKESGAAYIFRRSDGTWAQEAYLKPTNTDAGDSFGFAVSISGNFIVVGAPFEDSNQTTVSQSSLASDDNGKKDAGAAYVFHRVNNKWRQQAYLKAANANESDHFGFAVAISGDNIVVGAPHEDGSGATMISDGNAADDNLAIDAGAAYVFSRSNDEWVQVAYLKAPNAEMSDQFGAAVAIYSDRIVVGSFQEENSTVTDKQACSDNIGSDTTNEGAAYVFVHNEESDVWNIRYYIKASNAHELALFGRSVAVGSDHIIVGSPGEASAENKNQQQSAASADTSAPDTGAVYVFLTSAIHDFN